MKQYFVVALAAGLVAAAPAHAFYYGFGGSLPDGSQTLVVNGVGGMVPFDTGWFDSNGLHHFLNDNFAVGIDYLGVDHRNFFVFDSQIGVTSLALQSNGFAWNFDGHPSMTWTLYDVSSVIDLSHNYSGAAGVAIYNDLGTGIVYGTMTFFSQPAMVTVSLNAAGIAAYNAAGNTGSAFTIGGALVANAVPEPASWALMITGFGLTGGALRRRAVVTA
jgi:hypothetical protein